MHRRAAKFLITILENSKETRDSRLSFGEDPESLSPESVPGRDGQTDRRTDGQTEFP